MEKSSSKIVYIIFGAVLLVVIPVFIALLGFLGGTFYRMQGATN